MKPTMARWLRLVFTALGAAVGLAHAGAVLSQPSAAPAPKSLAAPASQSAATSESIVAGSSQTQDKPWQSIGRAATPGEVKAWDIDVRADFQGLPPGSGSVDDGMTIWDERCASCHGTFGESNEVFTPIVGGTTKQDIERGRVANLQRRDFPQRTTLMKLSQLSTLWDYVNRAMPWNAPKSLSTDEVYAVVAYMLNLGDIVPADFVLTDKNVTEVQARLPNRDGKMFFEPLWDIAASPDVQGDACMQDCKIEAEVRSSLPEHARNMHGNLAAQMRVVGAVRGVDTTGPLLASLENASTVIDSARATVVAPGERRPIVASAPALLSARIDHSGDEESRKLAVAANCMSCHGVEQRNVGPSFREVAERYHNQPGAESLLAGRVKNGTQGIWGSIPMPANASIPEEDVRRIVGWILGGAS